MIRSCFTCEGIEPDRAMPRRPSVRLPFSVRSGRHPAENERAARNRVARLLYPPGLRTQARNDSGGCFERPAASESFASGTTFRCLLFRSRTTPPVFPDSVRVTCRPALSDVRKKKESWMGAASVSFVRPFVQATGGNCDNQFFSGYEEEKLALRVETILAAGWQQQRRRRRKCADRTDGRTDDRTAGFSQHLSVRPSASVLAPAIVHVLYIREITALSRRLVFLRCSPLLSPHHPQHLSFSPFRDIITSIAPSVLPFRTGTSHVCESERAVPCRRKNRGGCPPARSPAAALLSPAVSKTKLPPKQAVISNSSLPQLARRGKEGKLFCTSYA